MANKKTAIVAAAQIRYFDMNKKDNVEKIKKYIRLAAKAKADIICFPETCVHRYNYLKINGQLVKQICQACRDNKIWCIITDAFTVKGKHYKISLLIDRDGKIRGKYKKINLYDDDVKAGNKIFVYQTDFAKIGIAICWDLAFPELFTKMKKAGAEIIFCPSYWCYTENTHRKNCLVKERKLLESLILSRAYENLLYFVYVNPLPGEPDLVSYSAIVSPHEIMKELKNKQGLIIQKLNLNQLKRFRKTYPNKK